MKNFILLFLSLQTLALPSLLADPQAAVLPRRAFLGVRLGLEGRVKIEQILPGGSAAKSSLSSGDLILSVDGRNIDSVQQFLDTMKGFRAGDCVRYRIRREGAELEVDLMLAEWPRESATGLDFIYDAVTVSNAMLRCIVTKPNRTVPKRLPGVLYIQGIDCASIEAPFDRAAPIRQWVEGLANAGFAVMRCEKSGAGDSTGPSCLEVGLADEVVGFGKALAKLKSYEFVDTENVFLFGHSAGGWVAPLVALTEQVRGIAVYGTVVRPFSEYLAENHRRNRRLRDQMDPIAIEEDMRRIERLLRYVLDERREPKEVLQSYPELVDVAKRVFPDGDDRPYGVRHLGYFREINDRNMAKVWANLDAHVLALMGEYDLRTSAFEHEYIADIVNFHHPGRAEWKELPRMDHGFALHVSLAKSATNEFHGPFGHQVVLETVEWMRKRITASRSAVLRNPTMGLQTHSFPAARSTGSSQTR